MRYHPVARRFLVVYGLDGSHYEDGEKPGMSMGQSLERRLGPIQLRASLHETIWGGENLRALAGKDVPPGKRIGESWETALDALATNPPYADQTLDVLTERYGVALIGSRALAVFGMRFPLLTKFIDAQAKLSVQVHPNDAYAAAHEGGKLGKTEVWYILHAEPGARVVYGLRQETTRDAVRRAIASNMLEDLLHSVEVRPGDVIFVPAGTVHAICAGVALYELQEYSDITYRLYDYGRLQADGRPRDLHVEQGLAVMRYAPQTLERVTPVARGERRVLVGCHYFVLEEMALTGERAGTVRPTSCQIVTVLSGRCEIVSDVGSVTLALGETAVLPATMGAHTYVCEDARLLRAWVPEPGNADLAAWRAAQSVPLED
jgi:mannose-6-phosphate isomerase